MPSHNPPVGYNALTVDLSYRLCPDGYGIETQPGILIHTKFMTTQILITRNEIDAVVDLLLRAKAFLPEG